jgi:cysteine desulfurase / selenocysteine lyase
LSAVSRLKIYGPEPSQKGPIVSFTVEGAQAHDLATYLDHQGVAVRHGHHCAMPLHEKVLGVPATTRASFGVYTSRADIDALADAIEYAKKKLRVL